jgi:hypothetical protein
MLGQRSIADQFDPAFLKTNFWLMWVNPRVLYRHSWRCTTCVRDGAKPTQH